MEVSKPTYRFHPFANMHLIVFLGEKMTVKAVYLCCADIRADSYVFVDAANELNSKVHCTNRMHFCLHKGKEIHDLCT